jgi:hypothetical protein
MKLKAFLCAFLACVSTTWAQVNTLPTSGKVGIGTTNPNEALEVKGNMAVDSSMVVKDTLIVEDDARIMHDMRVEGATEMHDVVINGTTWMKGLQEVNENDFGILVAKSDGTVMKSGPGGLFPVPNEPVGFCDLQGSTYNSNPYWVSQPEKLYTACPDVFVGVNTSTPRVGLDVIGTSYTRRLFMGDANPLQTNTDLYFHLNVPFSNTDNKTVFKIENDDRQLFSVNSTGLVRSREIKIDAEAWADYVFKPEFRLKTLTEVESYINENGHLPDVPSEAEVLENGINVAEMDAILLQKIEELTLYTIELEKRLAELEQENN